MSKGYGKVQRRILEILETAEMADSMPSTIDLAAWIYGETYTPAERSSVRRAVRGLFEAGAVDIFEQVRPDSRYSSTAYTRGGRPVSLPRTTVQAVREAQRERWRQGERAPRVAPEHSNAQV